MSKLSDERLKELIRWASDDGMPDAHRALLELQELRAAEFTIWEQVHQAVRNAFSVHTRLSGEEFAQRIIEDIATRVANQMGAPAVKLSSDEVSQ